MQARHCTSIYCNYLWHAWCMVLFSCISNADLKIKNIAYNFAIRKIFVLFSFLPLVIAFWALLLEINSQWMKRISPEKGLFQTCMRFCWESASPEHRQFNNCTGGAEILKGHQKLARSIVHRAPILRTMRSSAHCHSAPNAFRDTIHHHALGSVHQISSGASSPCMVHCM